MNIVFFGTSTFAAHILDSLLTAGFAIKAAVTRVDKPQGRNLALLPPPVKSYLQKNHPQIPILQPTKASTSEFEAILREIKPDIFVVVAYGEIIKKNILALPRLGCVNVHPSLLPKYRGAAPIHHTLLNGDKVTGVCIIEMSEAMDAGDILAQETLSIEDEDNFESLEKKLLVIAQKLIARVLKEKKSEAIKRTPQDHSHATLAPKITAEIEKICWQKTAFQIFNLIRALSPKPGAWCEFKIGNETRRLKILKAKLHPNFHLLPSQIASQTKKSIFIACSEGALELVEVQPEGKQKMTISQFLNGINKPISFS